MADNVDVTPGSGVTVAADDVGGVKYQIVKIDQGGDGVASLVTAASPQGVAPIAGQVGIAGGAGASDAKTTRVVLASDDALIGATNSSAAGADTGTFGLNALFKRLLAQVTVLLGRWPAALGSGGGLKVDGSGTALPVTVASGAVTVSSGASTATLANKAGSTSNQTAIIANASRKGFYIYNDSTQDLYVKLGATASTTSFTKKIATQDGWGDAGIGIYQGIIDIIQSSANGNARCTEW